MSRREAGQRLLEQEIKDAKQVAAMSVKFGDGRRGVLIADAHVDNAVIRQVAKVDRQQARRGRTPRAEAKS